MYGKQLFMILFARSSEIPRKKLSFERTDLLSVQGLFALCVLLFPSKLVLEIFRDNTASISPCLRY
jgi:hypothetical protein